MKNILVTGGAGFIGSNLCSTLLSKGHNVLCIDNLSTGNIENIKKSMSNERFKFYQADLLKVDERKIKNISEIYHFASPASPEFYYSNSLLTLDTIVLGTKKILEIAKLNNAKIFFASTSEVYGDALMYPQCESYFGNVNTYGLRSCYDEAKRVSETYCFEYRKIYNLEIIIGRIFNTYGPNMSRNDGRVIPNFINSVLNNQNIIIYGNGSQTRSFCFINDLINGIIKLMEHTPRVELPINIGGNEELSIKELAEMVIKKFNSNSMIEYQAKREDDPLKRKPCLCKIETLINWKPIYSLETGLEITGNYFKDLVM